MGTSWRQQIIGGKCANNDGTKSKILNVPNSYPEPQTLLLLPKRLMKNRFKVRITYNSYTIKCVYSCLWIYPPKYLKTLMSLWSNEDKVTQTSEGNGYFEGYGEAEHFTFQCCMWSSDMIRSGTTLAVFNSTPCCGGDMMRVKPLRFKCTPCITRHLVATRRRARTLHVILWTLAKQKDEK